MNRPTRVRSLRTRMFSCRLLALSLAIAALGLVFAGRAQATTTINPGFILFHTVPVSSIFIDVIPNPQTIQFEGNPFGSFDFGAGPVFVGDTDTIVERIQLADLSGGSATIDIELVALSLVSIAPVDLGFGAGFEDIFIELNTSSPSFQTMTITDTGEGQPHGTFDTTNNFFYDLSGSVGGFYTTDEATVSITNEGWQHEPTGSLLIDGINHLLNTSDETHDFWPNDVSVQNNDAGTLIHRIRAANIPEPSTFALAVLGTWSLGLFSERRKSVSQEANR